MATLFLNDRPSLHKVRIVQQIKTGIWIYFILLLFEGALRKWLLPSLATPLLIIRDPVALVILFHAIRYRLLDWNIYLFSMLLVGMFALIMSLLVGHGNLLVALYGLRPMLIHFPLIFVMASVFNKSDVEKIGKFLLWTIPPMTLLIALQFYSPQTAWVNRGIGGDVTGAGFSGALGYFRPPGTFSFTNGNTLFYSLAACFVFYFWLSETKVSKLLLVMASIGVLAAIPLSISRAYFFQFIITLGFSTICILSNPQKIGRGLLILSILIVSGIILTQFSFFQIGVEAFTARFESASKTEGGLSGTLGERFLGSLLRGFSSSETQSIWGHGIGMGTNAGAMLLAGNRSFLIAEEEWPRIVGEIGGILGTLLILIRVVLCISLSWSSFIRLKYMDFLPCILLSFGILQIVTAGWAQPTSLGFSLFTGGLILASFNVSNPFAIKK